MSIQQPENKYHDIIMRCYKQSTSFKHFRPTSVLFHNVTQDVIKLIREAECHGYVTFEVDEGLWYVNLAPGGWKYAHQYCKPSLRAGQFET